MRRTKNAKVVGRAAKDHKERLHKAVVKGKDRLPGQRAGVRRRTTTKTGNPGSPGKPTKGSPASPQSPFGPSGAPSWERHVHKRNVKFPLKEFDLAAMSDEELAACSKALGIRLS